MSGDRNIVKPDGSQPGTANCRTVDANATELLAGNSGDYRWSSSIHSDAGNLGLADGSAIQTSDSARQRQIESSGDANGNNHIQNP